MMFKEMFIENNTNVKITTELVRDAIHDGHAVKLYGFPSVYAAGTSGVGMYIRTNNKEAAEKAKKDIPKLAKLIIASLKDIMPGLKLDTKKYSGQASTGDLQPKDWRKDGPDDMHEMYINLKLKG